MRHGRGRQAISSMRARAYACVCVFIVYAYISLLIPRAPLMESPRQLVVGAHTQTFTWRWPGGVAGLPEHSRSLHGQRARQRQGEARPRKEARLAV